MSIPISRPLFGPEEFEAVRRPLESGWVVQGPFVKQFEDQFSAFTGAPHSAATSSCTTALHLAVAALGLRPGDEVIVPAFTWVSTANVVEYMGARPVFCDIELDTYNLDVAHAASLVTERTVGIIPVHLFGLCSDMAAVQALADRHGLWVVEDAACAFGSWRGDVHAGCFGVFGCFSFHPRKSITTGEGGMVTTRDAQLDALVRSLRDHGATRSDHARHHASSAFLLAEYPHLGYNYRMTDIQGALGVAQLARAAHILEERTRQARMYDERLASLGWLRTPVVPDDCVHGYQAYVCLFAPEEPRLARLGEQHERRNAVMAELERQGIATRQGTHAPVLQEFYARKYGLQAAAFPQSVIADRLTLALPLFAGLSDAELDTVCAALERCEARL